MATPDRNLFSSLLQQLKGTETAGASSTARLCEDTMGIHEKVADRTRAEIAGNDSKNGVASCKASNTSANTFLCSISRLQERKTFKLNYGLGGVRKGQGQSVNQSVPSKAGLMTGVRPMSPTYVPWVPLTSRSDELSESQTPGLANQASAPPVACAPPAPPCISQQRKPSRLPGPNVQPRRTPVVLVRPLVEPHTKHSRPALLPDPPESYRTRQSVNTPREFQHAQMEKEQLQRSTVWNSIKSNSGQINTNNDSLGDLYSSRSSNLLPAVARQLVEKHDLLDTTPFESYCNKNGMGYILNASAAHNNTTAGNNGNKRSYTTSNGSPKHRSFSKPQNGDHSNTDLFHSTEAPGEKKAEYSGTDSLGAAHLLSDRIRSIGDSVDIPDIYPPKRRKIIKYSPEKKEKHRNQRCDRTKSESLHCDVYNQVPLHTKAAPDSQHRKHESSGFGLYARAPLRHKTNDVRKQHGLDSSEGHSQVVGMLEKEEYEIALIDKNSAGTSLPCLEKTSEDSQSPPMPELVAETCGPCLSQPLSTPPLLVPVLKDERSKPESVPCTLPSSPVTVSSSVSAPKKAMDTTYVGLKHYSIPRVPLSNKSVNKKGNAPGEVSKTVLERTYNDSKCLLKSKSWDKGTKAKRGSKDHKRTSSVSHDAKHTQQKMRGNLKADITQANQQRQHKIKQTSRSPQPSLTGSSKGHIKGHWLKGEKILKQKGHFKSTAKLKDVRSREEGIEEKCLAPIGACVSQKHVPDMDSSSIRLRNTVCDQLEVSNHQNETSTTVSEDVKKLNEDSDVTEKETPRGNKWGEGHAERLGDQPPLQVINSPNIAQQSVFRKYARIKSPLPLSLIVVHEQSVADKNTTTSVYTHSDSSNVEAPPGEQNVKNTVNENERKSGVVCTSDVSSTVQIQNVPCMDPVVDVSIQCGPATASSHSISPQGIESFELCRSEAEVSHIATINKETGATITEKLSRGNEEVEHDREIVLNGSEHEVEQEETSDRPLSCDYAALLKSEGFVYSTASCDGSTTRVNVKSTPDVDKAESELSSSVNVDFEVTTTSLFRKSCADATEYKSRDVMEEAGCIREDCVSCDVMAGTDTKDVVATGVKATTALEVKSTDTDIKTCSNAQDSAGTSTTSSGVHTIDTVLTNREATEESASTNDIDSADTHTVANYDASSTRSADTEAAANSVIETVQTNDVASTGENAHIDGFPSRGVYVSDSAHTKDLANRGVHASESFDTYNVTRRDLNQRDIQDTQGMVSAKQDAAVDETAAYNIDLKHASAPYVKPTEGAESVECEPGIDTLNWSDIRSVENEQLNAVSEKISHSVESSSSKSPSKPLDSDSHEEPLDKNASGLMLREANHVCGVEEISDKKAADMSQAKSCETLPGSQETPQQSADTLNALNDIRIVCSIPLETLQEFSLSGSESCPSPLPGKGDLSSKSAGKSMKSPENPFSTDEQICTENTDAVESTQTRKYLDEQSSTVTEANRHSPYTSAVRDTDEMIATENVVQDSGELTTFISNERITDTEINNTVEGTEKLKPDSAEFNDILSEKAENRELTYDINATESATAFRSDHRCPQMAEECSVQHLAADKTCNESDGIGSEESHCGYENDAELSDENDSQVSPKAVYQIVTESDAQIVTDSDAQIVTETDTQIVTETHTQVVAETNADVVTETDVQVVIGTNAQVITETDAQVATIQSGGETWYVYENEDTVVTTESDCASHKTESVCAVDEHDTSDEATESDVTENNGGHAYMNPTCPYNSDLKQDKREYDRKIPEYLRVLTSTDVSIILASAVAIHSEKPETHSVTTLNSDGLAFEYHHELPRKQRGSSNAKRSGKTSKSKHRRPRKINIFKKKKLTVKDAKHLPPCFVMVKDLFKERESEGCLSVPRYSSKITPNSVRDSTSARSDNENDSGSQMSSNDGSSIVQPNESMIYQEQNLKCCNEDGAHSDAAESEDMNYVIESVGNCVEIEVETESMTGNYDSNVATPRLNDSSGLLTDPPEDNVIDYKMTIETKARSPSKSAIFSDAVVLELQQEEITDTQDQVQSEGQFNRKTIKPHSNTSQECDAKCVEQHTKQVSEDKDGINISSEKDVCSVFIVCDTTSNLQKADAHTDLDIACPKQTISDPIEEETDEAASAIASIDYKLNAASSRQHDFDTNQLSPSSITNENVIIGEDVSLTADIKNTENSVDSEQDARSVDLKMTSHEKQSSLPHGLDEEQRNEYISSPIPFGTDQTNAGFVEIDRMPSSDEENTYFSGITKGNERRLDGERDVVDEEHDGVGDYPNIDRRSTVLNHTSSYPAQRSPIFPNVLREGKRDSKRTGLEESGQPSKEPVYQVTKPPMGDDKNVSGRQTEHSVRQSNVSPYPRSPTGSERSSDINRNESSLKLNAAERHHGSGNFVSHFSHRSCSELSKDLPMPVSVETKPDDSQTPQTAHSTSHKVPQNSIVHDEQRSNTEKEPLSYKRGPEHSQNTNAHDVLIQESTGTENTTQPVAKVHSVCDSTEHCVTPDLRVVKTSAEGDEKREKSQEIPLIGSNCLSSTSEKTKSHTLHRTQSMPVASQLPANTNQVPSSNRRLSGDIIMMSAINAGIFDESEYSSLDDNGFHYIPENRETIGLGRFGESTKAHPSNELDSLKREYQKVKEIYQDILGRELLSAIVQKRVQKNKARAEAILRIMKRHLSHDKPLIIAQQVDEEIRNEIAQTKAEFQKEMEHKINEIVSAMHEHSEFLQTLSNIFVDMPQSQSAQAVCQKFGLGLYNDKTKDLPHHIEVNPIVGRPEENIFNIPYIPALLTDDQDIGGEHSTNKTEVTDSESGPSAVPKVESRMHNSVKVPHQNHTACDKGMQLYHEKQVLDTKETPNKPMKPDQDNASVITLNVVGESERFDASQASLEPIITIEKSHRSFEHKVSRVVNEAFDKMKGETRVLKSETTTQTSDQNSKHPVKADKQSNASQPFPSQYQQYFSAPNPRIQHFPFQTLPASVQNIMTQYGAHLSDEKPISLHNPFEDDFEKSNKHSQHKFQHRISYASTSQIPPPPRNCPPAMPLPQHIVETENLRPPIAQVRPQMFNPRAHVAHVRPFSNVRSPPEKDASGKICSSEQRSPNFNTDEHSVTKTNKCTGISCEQEHKKSMSSCEQEQKKPTHLSMSHDTSKNEECPAIQTAPLCSPDNYASPLHYANQGIPASSHSHPANVIQQPMKAPGNVVRNANENTHKEMNQMNLPNRNPISDQSNSMQPTMFPRIVPNTPPFMHAFPPGFPPQQYPPVPLMPPSFPDFRGSKDQMPTRHLAPAQRFPHNINSVNLGMECSKEPPQNLPNVPNQDFPPFRHAFPAAFMPDFQKSLQSTQLLRTQNPDPAFGPKGVREPASMRHLEPRAVLHHLPDMRPLPGMQHMLPLPHLPRLPASQNDNSHVFRFPPIPAQENKVKQGSDPNSQEARKHSLQLTHAFPSSVEFSAMPPNVNISQYPQHSKFSPQAPLQNSAPNASVNEAQKEHFVSQTLDVNSRHQTSSQKPKTQNKMATTVSGEFPLNKNRTSNQMEGEILRPERTTAGFKDIAQLAHSFSLDNHIRQQLCGATAPTLHTSNLHMSKDVFDERHHKIKETPGFLHTLRRDGMEPFPDAHLRGVPEVNRPSHPMFLPPHTSDNRMCMPYRDTAMEQHKQQNAMEVAAKSQDNTHLLNPHVMPTQPQYTTLQALAQKRQENRLSTLNVFSDASVTALHPNPIISSYANRQESAGVLHNTHTNSRQVHEKNVDRRGAGDPPNERPHSETQPQHACACCGAEAMFLCSGCKSVSYCTVNCQAKMWKDHKPQCLKERQASDKKVTSGSPLTRL